MSKNEESKTGSRSRSRDRDCGDSLIIKVSNLKPDTGKDDVKEFLVDIEIEEISIADNVAIAKCANMKAVNAALLFDQKQLDGQQVQVRRCPADTAIASEKGALRLGNWPWRVTEEQIAEFFEGYNMVEGSLKFHVNEEGRKSGMAAVLFNSEEDAEKACKEKQRQDLGGRNANLWDLEVEEYNDFENWDPEAKDVRCGDSVTEDNVERCVKLRGLPWAANKGTVIEFFEGFRLKKKNITIDIQGGKNSGFAIVELENEEEAGRAVEELDRKEIGTRWVGVSAAEMRGRRKEQEQEAY